ncbi:hypothetical protein DFJ73DRAFT_873422 [Zopfochytrium polystomum]|nr:hypothetical protein DFJ73DRAFT_873422 [Zopfochytrium polystomum]
MSDYMQPYLLGRRGARLLYLHSCIVCHLAVQPTSAVHGDTGNLIWFAGSLHSILMFIIQSKHVETGKERNA